MYIFQTEFLFNYYVLLISFLLPSYAWVLQDILGISFCISLIKNIRLPNLKVCTILLLLLLIYDIFFVFITPLFSAGKSVMVQVATGKNFHYFTSILLIGNLSNMYWIPQENLCINNFDFNLLITDLTQFCFEGVL